MQRVERQVNENTHTYCYVKPTQFTTGINMSHFQPGLNRFDRIMLYASRLGQGVSTCGEWMRALSYLH